MHRMNPSLLEIIHENKVIRFDKPLVQKILVSPKTMLILKSGMESDHVREP